ncbi:MerC domain-containing protein [Idiomarina xiamenensis]|uniref:MerC-like membrane protein n=1 Tax=Idiomarina xiamenensis 10-D-4 TaxID=740709 RepID=K2KCZ0_9GAMM|nr:MerC domain-containing protein [Idiomarina xiamenensis]EKE84562.1 MerC-like membrane protein [Idiomarina xiamenensis 10-D-4]
MTNHSKLDKAGIWITTLCAIHCLLLPAILPALSVLGLAVTGDHTLEDVVLVLSMVIGLLALGIGARQHGYWQPIVLLLIGGVISSQKHAFQQTAEVVIISTGALFIIAAHLINLRLMRRHQQVCNSCNSPAIH